MNLYIDGLVNASGSKGPGCILLTDQSAFFFFTVGNPGAWAAGGGLIGALIGQYLARKKAEKNLPAHLSDPEIQGLEEKVRRKLLTTKLLVKIPFNSNTEVQETRMGYRFGSVGQEAEISSWGNKKKIARALFEKGIVAQPRR